MFKKKQKEEIKPYEPAEEIEPLVEPVVVAAVPEPEPAPKRVSGAELKRIQREQRRVDRLAKRGY